MNSVRNLFLLLPLALACTHPTTDRTASSTENAVQEALAPTSLRADLDDLLSNLAEQYIYRSEKEVDLDCLRQHYRAQLAQVRTEEEGVLLFEYLLDEFYDSHLILNTNRSASFRLYAPLYATIEADRARIVNVWQSQVEEGLETGVLGAEILRINGRDWREAVAAFPTYCHDKSDPKVREWLLNKVLAGRYNEPRILNLRRADGSGFELDLDGVELRSETALLKSERRENFGIIRLHNSLGNNDLVGAFDRALDALSDTEGLILDLRNTVDGGNSYVARAILGRFVAQPQAYQKHWLVESYDGQAVVERSWLEYVSPRASQYLAPVVVLVGRWTGSMGEGLAVGFEGTEAAQVVGTEMERLAGEMNGFSLAHQSFGYRLSTAKLYHVDGTPREEYRPPNYVVQADTSKDEALAAGLALLRQQIGLTE